MAGRVWSFLPNLTLPSLPIPSIPANVQNKLLSYLLGKSLGTFIKGHDWKEGVEGDIGKGRIRLGTVELDESTIQGLLEGLPIDFIKGSTQELVLQISSPISLLSSSISIQLHHLDLTLRLNPTTDLSSSTSTLSPSHLRPHSEGGLEDVATSFIRDELTSIDDQQLRESLHLPTSSASDDHLADSDHSEIGLPGAFTSSPSPASDGIAEEEVTLLATFIERLLGRLNASVQGVTVRVLLGDDDGGEEELELSIASVEYGTNDEGRYVKVDRPEVRLHRPHSTPPSSKSDSDSDSEEEESDEDITPYDDLAMSQSIADLGLSTVSLASSATGSFVSATGGGSVYASILPQDNLERIAEDDDPFQNPDPPSPPPAPSIHKERKTTTLVSFGNEPLLFHLLPASSTSRKAVKVALVHKEGLSVVLEKEDVGLLLDLVARFTPSGSSGAEGDGGNGGEVSLDLELGKVVVRLGYEEQDQLRLTLDGLKILLSSAPAKGISISVRDVGLVEYGERGGKENVLVKVDRSIGGTNEFGEGRSEGMPVLEMGGVVGAGRKRGTTGRGEGEAVRVEMKEERVAINSKPLHIIVDLLLLEKFIPFVSYVLERLPSSPSPSPTLPTPTQSILSDLSPPSPQTEKLKITLEYFRIEVKCPAPGVKDVGRPLRSGVLVLDLRALEVIVRKVDKVETVEVRWEKAWGLFKPALGTKAISFVGIAALGEELDSLLPSLSIIPSPTASTSIVTRFPLVRVSLDKPTLDGLQLFADDLAQWSSNAAGEGEEREEKLVGSRYFGGKSLRGREEDSEELEGEEDGERKMEVRVGVSDVVVDLFVEEKRHLRGLIRDLDVGVDVFKNEKNDLRVEAVVVDVDFHEVTEGEPRAILARTLPRNLASGSIPLVKLTFTTAVEKETHLKESKIDLTLANFTYFATADLKWLDEVSAFAKAPDGAFEQVVPNELTRIRLRIADGSIHVSPPRLQSHLVLSLAEAKIATNLMPDLPRTRASVEVRGLKALMVESRGDLEEGSFEVTQGDQYWRAKGFAQLADLQQASIVVKQGNGLVLPDLELLVSDVKLNISICADSVAAVGALAADFSSVAKAPPSKAYPSATRSPPRKSSRDMLSSVDPTAFTRAQVVDDAPEYLDDDVPANLDYLADAFHHRTFDRNAKQHRASAEATGQIISDVDGETIRMLDPNGLCILDNFLNEPRVDPDDETFSRPASLVRCRLSNCDVSIHNHEGFDWQTTRKAIEEEAKAVRRRLEKIRQLLAEGQTADATRDDTSTLIFGSVHLGLPPGASELPENQLLAAINDELDARSEAPSEAESWQSLPGQPLSQKPVSVGRGRRRLTRSRAFAIEVNLRGVSMSFDSYPSPHQLASKLRVDVDAFEIIDNIRTSTWRKFLTELRASDGGMVRASGASMVRFELDKVRPAGKSPSASEEILMKIKIAPLRLYIDQDALDFLKSFGGFKMPPSAASASPNSQSVAEPFFQRVEVLPVKIKLDYKPKRVDYHALRQGKTAELMNFFHFDGSEMTLRHLVVSGISGITRLSELVQDIWTPDVKANQLADVIAGIAPVRSVVNLGSGVANLVLLPLEQYKKDGRLARGLQRGASAFARSTTLEALNVGARLATGTQVILEQAEAVLGAKSFAPAAAAGETLSGSSHGPSMEILGREAFTEEEIDEISRYAQQPNDLREGMEEAYKSLGDNFRSAAQTILAVPMEVYERSGNEGPVRAVVRAVPIAVLKPMIGATGAVSKALFGLRNSLDPDAQAEVSDKYKTRPSPAVD